MANKIQVLFVCLGNICRSPTAEAVFREQVCLAELSDVISIDSAGTSNYHIGGTPDNRSIEFAQKRGYQLEGLRARQVSLADFSQYDYILAMDLNNLNDLNGLKPRDSKAKVKLMMHFATDEQVQEVPDPYYGGSKGFDNVLDLLENASAGLLNSLVKTHNL